MASKREAARTWVKLSIRNLDVTEFAWFAPFSNFRVALLRSGGCEVEGNRGRISLIAEISAIRTDPGRLFSVGCMDF